MEKFDNFIFEKYDFDLDTWKASFFYSFDSKIHFEECIYFYDDNFEKRKDLDIEIIKNILSHIHIALWISYYKILLPNKLIVKSTFLDDYQINFWKKFYLNWLWEFFFKNNINPEWLLNFYNFWIENTYLKNLNEKINFKTSEKYLVPVWGWKDSIVSIELLKNFWKNIDLVTFSQNDNILYENTSEISWNKRLFIRREISKNILDYSNPPYYNWHVPITWIIAFVLELACYIYDYKYIVLSNEKSANFWNTTFHWVEVNHQWSKSYEFERDFWDYVFKYISNNTKYFSLLRPFYELKIAEVFSKLWKKYFKKFSSCNVNFKIFKKILIPNPSPEGEGSSPLLQERSQEVRSYWCKSCPKCAFVYAILRPFLTKEETLEIFSRELYEDESLEKLFRELAWISWIKPFECVWTNEEVVLAMKMALNKFDKLPFILKIFEREVDSKMSIEEYDNLKNKILTLDFEENLIPEELKNLLKSHI